MKLEDIRESNTLRVLFICGQALLLAEHIPFIAAYVFSAGASTALISLYSITTLGSRIRASMVFTVLIALYACLYTALRSETYAMLIGSLGLFVVLASIMSLTRHIDWRQAGMQRRGKEN